MRQPPHMEPSWAAFLVGRSRWIVAPCAAAVLLLGIGVATAAFTAQTGSTSNSFGADTVNPPTGAVASGGSTITVDWTATADTYASGHRVLRATTAGGPYTQIAELTPRTSTSYEDSPAPGTYYYVVRAFHQSWESANSNEVSATATNNLEYAGIGPPASRTSSGTLSVSMPAGTAEDDLLLLVEVNLANQNITTPTGWTLIADAPTSSPEQNRFTVWWKLAGPSEPSVGLSVHTNSRGATAWAIRYTRPAGYPPTPVTATASPSVGTAGETSTATPSPDITTNAADATVISLVTIRDGNTLSLSAPRGFTLQTTEIQSATGDPRALGVADIIEPGSGATPPSPTWAQAATPAQWAWITLAFA